MFSIHRVSAGADDAEGTELELAEDAPHPMRPSRARAARGVTGRISARRDERN